MASLSTTTSATGAAAAPTAPAPTPAAPAASPFTPEDLEQTIFNLLISETLSPESSAGIYVAKLRELYPNRTVNKRACKAAFQAAALRHSAQLSVAAVAAEAEAAVAAAAAAAAVTASVSLVSISFL